jgi:hypothetical protein
MEGIESVVSVDERANFERDVTSMREKVGKAAYEAPLAEGRDITVEQAIRYSLRESPDA